MKHRRDRPDLHHDSGATRRKQSSRDLGKRHRKRAQLIAQIAQSVQFILADLDDEDLCALTYSHIELVHDGSHLRVVMCAPPATQAQPVDLRALERALNARASEVRASVAQDIHRKRAPLLSFAVIPREPWRG